MNDLKRRLRDIEGFAPPDLWEEITSTRTRPAPAEPGPARKPLVVAIALLIGLAGVVLVVRAFGGADETPQPAATVENGPIAFMSEVSSDLYVEGAQTEIFAMNPDGTERVRLTHDPEAFDEDPAPGRDPDRLRQGRRPHRTRHLRDERGRIWVQTDRRGSDRAEVAFLVAGRHEDRVRERPRGGGDGKRRPRHLRR